MKKTLLIVLAIILVFSLVGCAKPEEQMAAPLPTIVAPTIVPTAIPTIAPTPIPTTTPAPTLAIVFVGQVMSSADEFVNIRKEASTDSEIVGTFASGEVADVIEYLDGWVYISFGGAIGYVSREYTVSMCVPEGVVPMGDWALILVNPTNLLPQGFAVELADFEGGQVDVRILGIAEEMFFDAKNDGVEFLLVDAYRSEATQSEQYEEMVQRYINKGYSRADAETKAATITARPNTSEHQTGLVLDIVTPSYTKRNSGFADTDAFLWLDNNAQNYGFTLRYKQGKEEFTKVIYESWHWRFVGVEAAKEMKASGECFEEYLGILD